MVFNCWRFSDSSVHHQCFRKICNRAYKQSKESKESKESQRSCEGVTRLAPLAPLTPLTPLAPLAPLQNYELPKAVAPSFCFRSWRLRLAKIETITIAAFFKIESQG